MKKAVVQLLKYGIVGLSNTFLTLFAIYLCNSIIGINDYVSNGIGYLLGFINSFMWNKTWVFKSHGKVTKEAALFLFGFCLCYSVQLLVVWLINQSSFGDREFRIFHAFVLSGYGIATLIGNVVYTLCNFVYNKLITFQKAE